MNIIIQLIKKDFPYHLLLLADETIEGINTYLFDSDVYIAKLQGEEEPIGVFCLFQIDEDTVELMNVAVDGQCQNKGIGSLIMEEITTIAAKEKYKEIIVGTADCAIAQIHFYEKNGFCQYDIKENFFLEKYEQPIYENGVMLKDMVMLKKSIPN